MSTTRISTGERVAVVAAAGRTSGVPVVEQNIAGVPEVTAATGVRYDLKIEGEFEVPFIASSVKGDRVDIHNTTFALTRVAHGGAVVASTRPFAVITAVPGDGPTADAGQDPKTGKMWAKLLPQQVVQAT